MNPDFSDEDVAISGEEFVKLINYLDKNLVMGIECERALPVNPRDTARHLGVAYLNVHDSKQPSMCLPRYKTAIANAYNVSFVTDDGSVTGGNEIIFSGVIESFDWIKKRLLEIERKLDQITCSEFSTSTSNHMSFVTLQDKIVPRVFLMNVYELFKAFEPVAFWLGSGCKAKFHRGTGYCPIMANPPATLRAMVELNRQSINFARQTRVLNTDIPTGVRVEFRQVDGIRSPTVLTALLYFHRAIIYKSAELAMKGRVNYESFYKDEDDRLYHDDLLDEFIQCHRRTAFSETSRMDLRKRAKEVIDYLSPVIKQMSPEALVVLKKLANTPVSMLRTRQGMNGWKAHEKFYGNSRVQRLSDNEMEIIKLSAVGDVIGDNAKDWKKRASAKLDCSVRMVEYLMKKVEDKTGRRFKYDDESMRYRLS